MAEKWQKTIAATSRKRLEFELLTDPTTMTTSHLNASCLTAS